MAGKIRFADSVEQRAIIAEIEAEFKRVTGWDYPQTDNAWRKVFAAAGFTPQEERELRTLTAAESAVAEYYSTPGSLWFTLLARLRDANKKTDSGALTKVVTKAYAAAIHNGARVSNPTDYINNLVASGMLTAPVGSGQKWRFILSEFPPTSQEKLR